MSASAISSFIGFVFRAALAIPLLWVVLYWLPVNLMGYPFGSSLMLAAAVVLGIMLNLPGIGAESVRNLALVVLGIWVVFMAGFLGARWLYAIAHPPQYPQMPEKWLFWGYLTAAVAALSGVLLQLRKAAVRRREDREAREADEALQAQVSGQRAWPSYAQPAVPTPASASTPATPPAQAAPARKGLPLEIRLKLFDYL